MSGRGNISIGVIVAFFLALFWLQAVTAVRDKSPTFDEPVHFVAGYTYWAMNDYRLNPEGGNWLQRWAALPLVLGHEPPYGDVLPALLLQGRMMMAFIGMALGLLIFIWSRQLWGITGGFISLVLYVFSPDLLGHSALVTTDVGTAFFFAAATWSFWHLLHQLNWKSLLLCGVCTGGLFLAKFSAIIFLPVAAVLLLLRILSGRSLSIRIGYRSYSVGEKSRQVAALLPAFLLAGAIIWGMIWVSYGCRYYAPADATPGARPFFHPETLLEPTGIMGGTMAIVNRHHLLPEAYIYGFCYTCKSAQQRSSFLCGNYSTTGWRWFFPYAFMVKTPLPFLMVLLLALGAIGYAYRDCATGNGRPLSPTPNAATAFREKHLYDLLPVLALSVIYFGFAVCSHINIGFRHVLPVFSCLFILSGAAALWLMPQPHPVPVPGEVPVDPPVQIHDGTNLSAIRRQRIMAGLILVLLVWQAGESWRIRPHYLAYFNQLAGGPANGYRCLVDSSLDWGQDLPGLRDWLKTHRQPYEPVYLSYFGSTHPRYYNIDAILLPGFVDWRPPPALVPPQPLLPGIYCLSATMLQVGFDVCPGQWTTENENSYQYCLKQLQSMQILASKGTLENELRNTDKSPSWISIASAFEWLRLGRLRAYLQLREPDAKVGYSILIYRLTEDDLHAALNGPPALPDQ